MRPAKGPVKLMDEDEEPGATDGVTEAGTDTLALTLSTAVVEPCTTQMTVNKNAGAYTASTSATVKAGMTYERPVTSDGTEVGVRVSLGAWLTGVRVMGRLVESDGYPALPSTSLTDTVSTSDALDSGSAV